MSTTTTPPPPAPTAGPVYDLSHREIVRVFIGLMIGMLLAALDQTIVATALPTIVGDLGGLGQLSWVITVYLLTETIAMPVFGKLSDVHGRKRVFQAAIVLFVAGSVAAGLSRSMGQLIAFRAVQGVGAGGLITGAFTIIGDIVAPRERGRYQGYIGSVFAVASVIGPLLGGFFVDHFTWRWAFYVNVPLSVVALVVTDRNLNLRFVRTSRTIDWGGAVLLGTGLTAVMLTTVWGGSRHAWSSPVILGLIGLAVAAFAGFVVQERRAAEPVLPLELFRNDIFTVANLLGFTLGVAMFGAIVFLPVFLQVSSGVSATRSGMLMLPLMGGVLTASIVVGRLMTRFGRYRPYPILGTSAMAVGFALLSTLGVGSPPILASAYMVVVGIGVGTVMPVLVLAIQNSVEHRHLGVATSSAQVFRQIGGSIGVAVFGALFTRQLTASLAGAVPADALARNVSPEQLVATPATIAALPDALRATVREAVATSATHVFRVAVPVALVGFVLAWLLREARLRSAQDLDPGNAPDPAVPALADLG